MAQPNLTALVCPVCGEVVAYTNDAGETVDEYGDLTEDWAYCVDCGQTCHNNCTEYFIDGENQDGVLVFPDGQSGHHCYNCHVPDKLGTCDR